jgi:glucose-fructose oxidoreductase
MRANDLLQGKRKLGVALIGLGSYSRGQLGPALRETNLCELRGVVTGDADNGKRWAQSYGFSPKSVYSYDNMAAIADDPDIDIVYSVTPPGLHKRDVLAGAAAGKHVICEKPMAVSVAECDAMIAACEAAKVRLSIGYRLHFHAYHQRVKQLAATGGWGGPVTMNGGFGYRDSVKSWRTSKALGGGGQLMNVGIYVIQSALMAKGEEMPIAITAHEPPKTRPDFFDEVEETMKFTLEFADGSKCEGMSSGEIGANHFEVRGSASHIRLAPAFSYNGLRMTMDGNELPAMDGFNQQAHQMDGFAAAILNDEPSIVPGAMGLRDIRVTSAIYEAALTGKRVLL